MRGSADYLRAHPPALAARDGRRPEPRDPRHGPQARFERGAGPVFVERRNGRVVYRDARGAVLRVEP